MSLTERFKKWYRGLPEQKRYFEFIGAVLAIPVLLTVLLLNLGSLKKEEPKPTPAPKEEIKVIIPTQEKETSPPPAGGPTSASCKKEVGPVEISSPTENQTLTEEPVCFNIEYKDESYCSVVWSYRVDNSSWSEFTDKSICLYNLSSGDHKFELRVKSTASSDEVQLVRNFTFKGKVSPTPTPTPSQ